MSHETSPTTPEINIGPQEDNARKFTLEGLSDEELYAHSATSYDLTVDWLEMGEGDETKLARKVYSDGTVVTVFIRKVTVDGSRVPTKRPLTDDEYTQMLTGSLQRIVKRRSEFKYVQDHVVYDVKYDDFHGSSLRMLEVDPQKGEEGIFDPDIFTRDFGVAVTEVSDDERYTGYRVAEVLHLNDDAV